MESSIPAGTHIGHIHLKVANLDNQIGFYRDVMGFDLQVRMGDQAAFLSAGGYHHHLGLNTWQSKDGEPPPANATGLFHFAINYPARRDLAAALKRIYDNGWQIDGASDHGTHEALYMHDPEMNGMELAWDRERSEWFRDGQIIFDRTSLNFASLLGELNDPATAELLPKLAPFT